MTSNSNLMLLFKFSGPKLVSIPNFSSISLKMTELLKNFSFLLSQMESEEGRLLKFKFLYGDAKSNRGVNWSRGAKSRKYSICHFMVFLASHITIKAAVCSSKPLVTFAIGVSILFTFLKYSKHKRTPTLAQKN